MADNNVSPSTPSTFGVLSLICTIILCLGIGFTIGFFIRPTLLSCNTTSTPIPEPTPPPISTLVKAEKFSNIQKNNYCPMY
jgi:tellurite resistance protein TehA-like permease